MTSAFPAWMYGPAGEAQIFECAEDIPAGWADAPGKAPVGPLDRDRDGEAGGSLPRRKKAVKKNGSAQ